MKTRNLTPFLHGFKVTSREPPQVEMTVVVRASFLLRPGEPLTPLEGTEQGAMTSEMFADDDDERAGRSLYPGDFADFKPRAELFVEGSCYPPGDEPVPACMVEWAVGEWSKTLMVMGARSWKSGLLGDSIAEPEPFTTLPLTYEHAFGGPEFATNPCGKGHGSSTELPCIEDPGHLIHSRLAKPTPAGFGPISSAWPPRAAMVGHQYGERWKKKRSPWYSKDFNWEYFNAAPADQQIKGYLAGDESFRFKHLHRDVEEFSGELPALKIRAFLKDLEGRFEEVPMQLDTFHADIEGEVLKLTWRGLTPIATDDMSDVATMLIASEAMGSTPVSADDYRAKLEAFEADPMSAHVPEDLQLAAESAEEAEEAPAADNPLAPVLKSLFQGMAPEQEKLAVSSVTDIIARADAANLDLRPHIAKAVAKMPEQAGFGSAALVGAPLPTDLGKSIEAMKVLADNAMTLLQAQGGDTSRLDRFYKMLENPILKKLGYSPAGEKADPEIEPGPQSDLSGRDLAQRDLSGVDLSGAKLDGADLTGAKLVGTNLGGASLEGTILYKADLSGANLAGSTIRTANLGEINATGANFSAATIEQVSFDSAQLNDAIFDDVQGVQCLFTKVTFDGARLARSSFSESEFSESTFEGTDFSDGRFLRCRFGECKINGGNLSGIDVTRTSFAGSELRDCCFVRITGDGSIWDGATLDGSDFSLARLHDSHFTEIKGERVKFLGADLRRARLFKATITLADFHDANLMGADLSKATLSKIIFSHANLYDAKFYKSTIEECVFIQANVKMALLELP